MVVLRFQRFLRCRFPVSILMVMLLGGAAEVRSQEKPAEAWVPLFNEKNLDGWVLVNTPSETWKVEDRMLVCSGKPIGELRTKSMYQNFILELEWRHMVPKGNAGVFVWADDITARGVPFHRSIEVQVLENAYGNSPGHTTHGDIFPIHGATMTPIHGRGGSRAFPTEERSKPSPEWNHYRIHCENGNISLAVNGKVVTQGKEASPRKGYICLESEGGVVHYRNVRIQVLPDTPVDPKDVAIAHRGYRSLYSGLDLRGWTASNPQLWKVNDWTLRHEGSADSNSTLTSENVFGDFGFVTDIKLLDRDSAVEIRFLDGRQSLSTQRNEIAEKLEKIGSWNRFEGSLREGVFELRVNNQPVSISEKWVGEKGPWVLVPTGRVDFANLYVR